MKILWPVDKKWPITQHYGNDPAFYATWHLAGHEGTDYGAACGEPVRAAHSGVLTTLTAPASYGLYATIAGGGVTTLYGHLQRVLVGTGTQVMAGQAIGEVGSSGATSTACHLHFGLKIAGQHRPAMKDWLDPEPLIGKEFTMRSKLGFHLQKPEYPGWLVEHIRRGGAQYVKIINPDAGTQPPFAGEVKIVGRLWWPGEPDKEMIWQGEQGAEAWWALAWPRMRQDPWVSVWEGPNEPAVTSVVKANQLVNFELRRVYLMHMAGLKTLSYQLGTGNPGDMELWRILGLGLAESDGLALHQYGMRRMDLTPDHLLRHREAIRILRDEGYRIPPIYITESGIDYRGDADNDGWQAQHISEDNYLAQLVAYDYELRQDSEVVCWAPFTWLHDGWPSFDIPYSLSNKIADYMRESEPLDERIGAAMQQHIIPLNPQAAFERAGAVLGLLPAGEEFDVTVAGVTYRVQAYRHPDRRDRQYGVYARTNQWEDLHWFERIN